MSHLASIFLLLHKMITSRSARGISFKSQALYLLVFVTRYLDLFTNFHSLYNSVMKVFFIASAAYTCYLMKVKFRPTQDPSLDTFNIAYILAPSAVAAVIFTHAYTVTDILWTFSLWVESLAILPQLFMLQRTGEADNITTHYLAALGLYRGLYIPNWIYRYMTEAKFDWSPVLPGIIQTALYADFGYIYVTKVLKGEKFELPA